MYLSLIHILSIPQYGTVKAKEGMEPVVVLTSNNYRDLSDALKRRCNYLSVSYTHLAWKKGCKFAIWKDDRFVTSLGKKVSYEMVKILLEHGKVGFRGCVSKRGNKFSAYFYYEKDEKTKRYNWRLEFIDTNPPS